MENRFDPRDLLYQTKEELDRDITGMYRDIAKDKKDLAMTRTLSNVYLGAKKAGIVSEALPKLEQQIIDTAREEWGKDTVVTFNPADFSLTLTNELKRRQEILKYE